MLNKIIFCALVLTLFISEALAQSAPDEFKKNEFFVGYSGQYVDIPSRNNLNGFEVSYVRNFSRYFGFKADFSGGYKAETRHLPIASGIGSTAVISYRNDASRHLVLGGFQVKDNATKARFKPFAHALFGIEHGRTRSKGLACISGPCPIPPGQVVNQSFSQTRFTTVFGGGLDIRINDKIDFRAVQVDYNLTPLNGRIGSSLRFGFGLVFH